MVTLKDVAREVGTSLSTVSRVVRNSEHVSDELRNQILQACDRLGYIPDSNAKSLRNGKSNTIGIIVSDVNNYFYNLILGHLVNKLRENKYKVLIGYSHEKVQIEKEILEMFMEHRVDAIIITPVSDENKHLIELIRKRKTAIVQLYRRAYRNIDSVCVDDSYGAYLATNHLIEKGYKRIALFSVNIKFTPHRSEGYRQAYREHGFPLDEELILKLPPDTCNVNEILNFVNEKKPDAIIAGTNLIGIDTLQALKEGKVENMTASQMIVFDDMPWMELLEISAISQPIELLAEKCLETVLRAISDDEKNEVVVERVVPNLIVREK